MLAFDDRLLNVVSQHDMSVPDSCQNGLVLAPYWIIILGTLTSILFVVSVTSGGTSFTEKILNYLKLDKCGQYCLACWTSCCAKCKKKKSKNWSEAKYPSLIQINIESEHKKYFELFSLMGYYYKKNLPKNDGNTTVLSVHLTVSNDLYVVCDYIIIIYVANTQPNITYVHDNICYRRLGRRLLLHIKTIYDMFCIS